MKTVKPSISFDFTREDLESLILSKIKQDTGWDTTGATVVFDLQYNDDPHPRHEVAGASVILSK